MRIESNSLVEATSWWEVASHPSESLNVSWREVHLAAQPAAELARAFAIPEPDDSHTAFEWVSGTSITDGYFQSGLIETPRGVVRSALRLFDMTLFLINADGDVYDELVLPPPPDVTLEQAFGWVLTTVMNLFDIPVRQATDPLTDLPEHPVAHGAPFGEPNQLALVELVRLYSNTASLLEAMGNLTNDESVPHIESTGRVLCWPHHFDLARLFTLERDAQGHATRTVGMGLTPPDAISDTGYWYVSPWAAQPSDDEPAAGALCALPKLETGSWRERDNQPPMAMLSIDSLKGIEDGAAQHQLVAEFFAQAFSACLAER